MSLISCPECARSISEQAVSCPACGLPLRRIHAASLDPVLSTRRTVIIEATGKTYKALQVAGAVAIAVAVASCAAGSPGSGGWSGFVFLVGTALYAGGRVGAWWNHG
jgi:hypothetical protein